MAHERLFVTVGAADRSRLGLKANLADCRRIREVWLARKAENDNRDAGFSTALASQCTNELRAIAEEEAALAIGLLDRARQAIEAAAPIVKEYRDCVVSSESRGGDLSTLNPEVRDELATHDSAIARMSEFLAAFDAANRE